MASVDTIAATLALMQQQMAQQAQTSARQSQEMFGKLDETIDRGHKQLQMQIDELRARPHDMAGVKNQEAMQIALRLGARPAFARSDTSSTRGTDEGGAYMINPLRIFLFGLQPSKSRAQLRCIADVYCKKLRIEPVRILASPGKTFCSIIVNNMNEVARCCDTTTQVSFANQNFNIQGKPDREPRTATQKQGGRVTSIIFDFLRTVLQQAGMAATPVLGAYIKQPEKIIYKRELLVETKPRR